MRSVSALRRSTAAWCAVLSAVLRALLAAVIALIRSTAFELCSGSTATGTAAVAWRTHVEVVDVLGPRALGQVDDPARELRAGGQVIQRAPCVALADQPNGLVAGCSTRADQRLGQICVRLGQRPSADGDRAAERGDRLGRAAEAEQRIAAVVLEHGAPAESQRVRESGAGRGRAPAPAAWSSSASASAGLPSIASGTAALTRFIASRGSRSCATSRPPSTSRGEPPSMAATASPRASPSLPERLRESAHEPARPAGAAERPGTAQRDGERDLAAFRPASWSSAAWCRAASVRAGG